MSRTGTALELMSIGTVAERLGISTSGLRKMEFRGDIPAARRITGYDRRFYDAVDVEQIRRIIEERRAGKRQRTA